MGNKKYRPLKPRQVRDTLKRNGFVEKTTKGSHAQWEGYIGEKRRIVTVPDYDEYKDKSLIKSIIQQSGLDHDEFYK